MDFIKTVLPFLTTVLAGPVPGIATGLLNQIFPNKEIDTPETTVVSIKPLRDVQDTASLYVALTRHTKRLNVRTTGLLNGAP